MGHDILIEFHKDLSRHAEVFREGIHRQHCNHMSLFSFFRNKEGTLKINNVKVSLPLCLFKHHDNIHI
jgi:hypothetical protein